VRLRCGSWRHRESPIRMSMYERYCQHCETWYPVDAWDEDENVVRNGAGVAVYIFRSAACPGCQSVSDPLAAPLRERKP
jgi:hypothetical protein